MIVLGIIAWVLCAGIMYGVGMHVDPDEIESDPIFWMFLFVLMWPMFLLMGIVMSIVYAALRKLTKIGVFVACFLDKLFEKKGEQDG